MGCSMRSNPTAAECGPDCGMHCGRLWSGLRRSIRVTAAYCSPNCTSTGRGLGGLWGAAGPQSYLLSNESCLSVPIRGVWGMRSRWFRPQRVWCSSSSRPSMRAGRTRRTDPSPVHPRADAKRTLVVVERAGARDATGYPAEVLGRLSEQRGARYPHTDPCWGVEPHREAAAVCELVALTLSEQVPQAVGAHREGAVDAILGHRR